MRILIIAFLSLVITSNLEKSCDEKRLICEEKCGYERTTDCLLKCYQEFNNCYFKRQ